MGKEIKILNDGKLFWLQGHEDQKSPFLHKIIMLHEIEKMKKLKLIHKVNKSLLKSQKWITLK